MLVFAFRGLPFWHPKSIHKPCFFKTPSWRPFLMILCWFHPKMLDCENPSKSSGRQSPPTLAGVRCARQGNAEIKLKWRNMSRLDFQTLPLWTKVCSKSDRMLFYLHPKTSKTKSLKIRPWMPKASILIPFWCQLDLHFRSIFLTS